MTTMTPWRIKGREFINCNCDWGCPCQFNALPTHGDCKAVGSYIIDEGFHGDVRLDGLHAALLVRWPKAIHEGDGELQVIVDDRGDEAQREAIRRILHGDDTEAGATIWQIFAATFTTVHDTLYRPIGLEVDVDGRVAKLSIPGVVEAVGEPIRNPVTGETHRARIDLPNGFEYTLAEMGSGTMKSEGPIALELAQTYGQFARIHMTHEGVVR